MAESGVIEGYLTVLSAQLPPPIVEELADGLDQTWARYRDQGLEPGAAASAAVAEFGDPHVILADFVRLSPARRTARKLLLSGPTVGGSWAMALIVNRAWTWPVPWAVSLLLGLALVTVIGMLVGAAFGKRYRSVGRAGIAGCVGMTVLDVAVVLTAVLATPTLVWPLTLAVAASAGRLTYTSRALRPVLTA